MGWSHGWVSASAGRGRAKRTPSMSGEALEGVRAAVALGGWPPWTGRVDCCTEHERRRGARFAGPPPPTWLEVWGRMSGQGLRALQRWAILSCAQSARAVARVCSRSGLGAGRAGLALEALGIARRTLERATARAHDIVASASSTQRRLALYDTCIALVVRSRPTSWMSAKHSGSVPTKLPWMAVLFDALQGMAALRFPTHSADLEVLQRVAPIRTLLTCHGPAGLLVGSARAREPDGYLRQPVCAWHMAPIVQTLRPAGDCHPRVLRDGRAVHGLLGCRVSRTSGEQRRSAACTSEHRSCG